MIEMNWSTPPHITHRELTYIERLLVHAQRQWVADRSCWSNVVLEFNRACGPRRATRICEALESAFRTLGQNARRQIRLHPVVCCRISHDETCLLNLLAAYQSRETAHAEALIAWLVSRQAAASLTADIDIVTRELCEANYLLEVRQPSARAALPQAMHAVR